MVQKSKPLITEAYQFSVAPMLDCTDRHFRVLMRQITGRALVYTEMIVAKALKYKNRKSLLDFDEIEHPIALQVGGDDPIVLSEAAQIAEEWGYDEINLNLGCPSPKVQSGNFGACLMGQPDQVFKCIEAMKKKTNIPVTIKHRTGIDNLDSEQLLLDFVDKMASAGADRFSIHARKALLNGFNAKENRSIPPLEYEKVAKIKKCRPNLKIELNGGLQNQYDCIKALKTFDGVMVGRAIYSNPLMWKEIDDIFFGEKKVKINASIILRGLIPYAEKHLSKNGRLWDICKHTLHLVQGVKGARKWRNELSQKAQNPKAELIILEKAARQLEDAGL
ncbi:MULTISPECIES: tRNA dihydrouridine(20/20a) synthase DusA [Prochlorococcus]|uniref:tRNA-dihydrouridine(20/20a) synthase n=1 Tax=Prochlorococcus marinus (strain SARG / CCMP1375 / SS120) TaxID=167539 RepID=Q7TVB2_PROMA|nr:MULTISPECIES: tRNA dihydrouridine(20/20a) synthase DusA [Prochlorococcus]AAP99060.1 tRNA-dihydrouridine synthase [Prochlorococcus marinus subsp. marinus str. CCMP1375]KGG11684.1 tRNA dihydrouridine synthase A [Prochlorococcus marinus str. LG]KGG22308.1 tRNA dihydrouridine synthase A [Prochlorococcus marinus str. SS2]KGG22645.1 tRNA dihydrouridine synthase A [Prochlorococcus marinus str. SS35]KGG32934.1 tRNA dihydrouridine synthase A [Prochlorococcus marinus str. SS51]